MAGDGRASEMRRQCAAHRKSGAGRVAGTPDALCLLSKPVKGVRSRRKKSRPIKHWGGTFAVGTQYLGLRMFRQSRSPRSRPWIRTSAVAILVATGMLCISHRRSRFMSFGSWGLGFNGSRKNSSRSTSLQAIRAAIC